MGIAQKYYKPESESKGIKIERNRKIMEQFLKKTGTFILGFIRVLMVLFLGILLLGAFFLTAYSVNMETQEVLLAWDSPLLSLPGTVIMGLFFLLPAAYISGKSLHAHRILRVFVLFWCIFCGITQILFGKTVPAADAYSVYDIAQSLALGDTSVIHPTESYLSYYPQQIGLAAFWELFIRLWKLTGIDQHAYHFIKIIYLLLGCVIIYYQEKIVHMLWQDKRADCLYLLLAGANCPFLMYTSFVYGEIPSFAAISIGPYLLLRFLSGNAISADGKKRPTSALFALGSLCFLTLGVMLRKNSLIFIIALVLVLLCAGKQCHGQPNPASQDLETSAKSFHGIQSSRPHALLLAGLYLFCALMILPCVQKFYESRSGSTIRSGVPAISYFAMGMQESSRANGWYNGFNFNTYRDTGMDTEATALVSRAAIQERLAYFQAHPDYAAGFYLEKFLSQWTDGSYACRQATLATFGGRSPFFHSLYEGRHSRYLIAYCNLYQNILYLGAFLFCLFSLCPRHIAPVPDTGAPGGATWNAPSGAGDFGLYAFLGLITVFGGFLFHMIWEANARYIFLYGLFLLPYTARGLSQVTELLSEKVNNTLRRRK